MRRMYKLDRKTHRYIIEPISDVPHIKFVLLKRFLSFTNKLANSSKRPVRMMYNLIKQDCLSTTGSNIRRIMHLQMKNTIYEVNESSLNHLVFSPIRESDKWKMSMVQEIVDIKNKRKRLEGFDDDQLSDILTYLTTS